MNRQNFNLTWFIKLDIANKTENTVLEMGGRSGCNETVHGHDNNTHIRITLIRHENQIKPSGQENNVSS